MVALLSISDLEVMGRKPGAGWRTILGKVSLEVAPGEVVALIGESGAGKTTLALSALGYCRAGTQFVGGQVRLGNTDVLALSRYGKQVFRGRDVAYVAQSAAAALNPSMKIGHQVGEGLRIHRLADDIDPKRRVEELLTLLHLPNPARLAGRYPQQTSGGQQQRVMLAMAMSCDPKLLVLDEPTTALDVTTQIEVLKAIKDAIHLRNAAAIYVSHDLSVVAQIATRIIVLRDGTIVEEGSTELLLSDPQQEYTRALLSAVRSIPKSHATARLEMVHAQPALLSVDAVDAAYRKVVFGRVPAALHVLRSVSLVVQPGETLALVGESGSGKSTLARVIAGLHAPIGGHIKLAGDVLASKARGRTKEQLRRIQIVFQSPEQALNPKVTVGDAIGRAVEFYFAVSAAEKRVRVVELLEMVGLPADFVAKLPGALSGGQRQRVAIARAFAAKPDLILCDEFLSALDTLVATRILELMAKLKREHGVAYVFISHDLATVATIADRVAVMYAGRIAEIGRTADIFHPPHHPYTGLLIQSVPELRTTWLDEAIARRADLPLNDGRLLLDDGCSFRSRCPLAIPGACDRYAPPLRNLGQEHTIHCHRELRDLVQWASGSQVADAQSDPSGGHARELFPICPKSIIVA